MITKDTQENQRIQYNIEGLDQFREIMLQGLEQ